MYTQRVHTILKALTPLRHHSFGSAEVEDGCRCFGGPAFAYVMVVKGPLAEYTQVCKLQPRVFLPLPLYVDSLEHTCHLVLLESWLCQVV